MSLSEPIVLAQRDGSATRIVLNRPQARNAVSTSMLEALSRALGEAAADPECRLVILAGEGKDFCAGADVQELVLAREGEAGIEYGRSLEAVIRQIEDLPQPVLAAVHGSALGAGCQIAVACDLAVATTEAKLGIPSARLGVLINYENVERLVFAVGPKRAAEMLLASRTVSGTEAAEWGLVNAAVPPAELADAVGELAATIGSLAPLSVQGSKRGIRGVLRALSLDRTAEGYRAADFDMMTAAAFASEDLVEGLAAFRERRPPKFRGR